MRRSNNAADALRVQLLFAVRTTPSFILEPYCPQLTSSFTRNEFLLVCSHLSNLNCLQPVHTGGGESWILVPGTSFASSPQQACSGVFCLVTKEQLTGISPTSLTPTVSRNWSSALSTPCASGLFQAAPVLRPSVWARASAR